jgi:hypothetical protein
MLIGLGTGVEVGARVAVVADVGGGSVALGPRMSVLAGVGRGAYAVARLLSAFCVAQEDTPKEKIKMKNTSFLKATSRDKSIRTA